jgi:hypothetical protein
MVTDRSSCYRRSTTLKVVDSAGRIDGQHTMRTAKSDSPCSEFAVKRLPFFNIVIDVTHDAARAYFGRSGYSSSSDAIIHLRYSKKVWQFDFLDLTTQSFFSESRSKAAQSRHEL